MLGSPIAHSRSPAIHSAAYAVLRLPWTYEAIEVTSAELGGFLDGLDRSWRGLSLTMPLKYEVIRHLHRSDELVRTVGAANTVLVDDGRLLGFNTDVDGAERMIAESMPTTVSRAAILGAGATARSVMAALARRGVRDIAVWARAPDRARDILGVAERLGVGATLISPPHPTVTLDEGELPDLVVSTLPGSAKLTAALPVNLRSTVPLVDIAYDPWPTSIGRHWLDAGGKIAGNGLDMLVYQALGQVRAFVGGDPTVELESEPDVLAAMKSAAFAAA